MVQTRSGRVAKSQVAKAKAVVKKTKSALKKVTKEVKDVKKAVANAKKVVFDVPSSSKNRSFACANIGDLRQKTRKIKRGLYSKTFIVRCSTKTRKGKDGRQLWRKNRGYEPKYLFRPFRGTKSPTTWNK